MLVAIFGEKDSHAVYFLHQKGVTRLDVVNFISHGISKVPQSRAGEERAADAEGEQESQPGGALESYTLNLNATGAGGQDRSADRPRPRTQRVVQTLCRRRKNNPLLVGEAGVGKTAIAEGPGAAHRRRAMCPEILQRSKFTRSTWARCSPAPSTAAISSSG